MGISAFQMGNWVQRYPLVYKYSFRQALILKPFDSENDVSVLER